MRAVVMITHAHKFKFNGKPVPKRVETDGWMERWTDGLRRLRYLPH